MKKIIGLLLLSIVSNTGGAHRVSLLLGEADTQLAFVRSILDEQYYYGNFRNDFNYTSNFFSLLGQNDVQGVESHALISPNGSTHLNIIADAVSNINSAYSVALVPVGSNPGIDFNRLCHLYRNRPDIVFVIPAGNSRVNYDFYQNDMNHCQARNIIMVASLNRQQNISAFSNIGQILRIGAVGERLLVENAFGWNEISGTGPAAATVAARLAEFSHRNPQLQGGELATEFIWSETNSHFNLNRFIRNGRALIE